MRPGQVCAFLVLSLTVTVTRTHPETGPVFQAGALSLPLMLAAPKEFRNFQLLRRARHSQKEVGEGKPYQVLTSSSTPRIAPKLSYFVTAGAVLEASTPKPRAALSARYTSARFHHPTFHPPIRDEPQAPHPTKPAHDHKTTAALKATVTTEFERRMRCQDHDTLRFYSSAMTCSNQRSDKVCAMLFAEPDPASGRRDPKCNVQGLEDIAESCRKQCGICCEDINYACEDDSNGIIDCSKQLDKCHMSKWFDVLSKFCAASCGLCVKTECRDFEVTCREEKELCLDSVHIDRMRERCARTCGFCVVGGENNGEGVQRKPPVPPCVDRAANCTQNERLCASPEHADFMIQYCARTCFKCNASPEPNVVVPVLGAPHDVNGTAAVLVPASVLVSAAMHNSRCVDLHPKCAVWTSKGFCTHQKYTKAQRKALCPKSCKLC